MNPLDQLHKTSLLALIFALAIVMSLSAQSVRWSPANGPYGGDNVTNVVAGRGVVYAASVERLYVSRDNGESWTRCSRIPADRFPIYGLAIDSSGNVLVGSYGGTVGLMRSSDFGVTWDTIDYPKRDAASIAIAPDGVIYVAGPSGVLHRSEDDGASRIATNLWSAGSRGVTMLSNGTLIATGIPPGGGGASIVRSFDRGANAVRSTGPTPGDAAIAFAHKGDTVFALTYNNSTSSEIWRSIDGGATFRMLVLQIDNRIKSCVAVDPRATLFVGTYSKGLYRSFDAGESWQRVGPTLVDSVFHSLAVADDGTIFAGTPSGPWRSIDGGETWTRVVAGMRETPVRAHDVSAEGKLYASTKYGIYTSSDKGGSWRELPPRATARPISVGAVASDNTFYVGDVDGQLHRFDPTTWSWSLAGARLDTGVTAIAFREDEDHIAENIIVGTSRGTIYRSEDEGATWNVITGDSSAYGPVTGLATTSDGAIYASTGSGLHRWTASSGWSRVPLVPPSPFFYAVASAGSHIVAVATDTGWVSSDMGESWRPLPSIKRELEQYYDAYSAVTVTSSGWVVASYLATRFNALPVFHTSLLLPGDTQWRSIEDGLEHAGALYSFARHPDGTLFGAFLGLYRTDLTTVRVGEKMTPDADVALSIEPMPIVSDARITITISSPGRYTLDLHEVAGRKVATVFDEELPSGSRTIDIDAGVISAGVYVLHLHGAGRSIRQQMIIVR